LGTTAKSTPASKSAPAKAALGGSPPPILPTRSGAPAAPSSSPHPRPIAERSLLHARPRRPPDRGRPDDRCARLSDVGSLRYHRPLLRQPYRMTCSAVGHADRAGLRSADHAATSRWPQAPCAAEGGSRAWWQRAFQVAHAQRDDACPRLHLSPTSRREPCCVARDHPCHPAEAANSSHSPGIPRSPTAPSGLKARSVPVTRSRTVRVTTTSRSPA
jgi:hypothetical protein